MRRAMVLASMIVLAGCTASTSPPTPTGIAPPPTPKTTSKPTTTASPSIQRAGTVAVGVPRPGSMVAAFGSVWVQSRAQRSIVRIRPDGRVLARIAGSSRAKGPGPFGIIPSGLDAGFGSVWSLTDDALVRIDPATNTVAARLPIALPSALDVGEGAVWVVCCSGEVKLLRIDPTTMSIEVFAELGTSLAAMAVGDGYVWWVRFSEGGGMDRVDLRTGAVVDLQAAYNDPFVVPTPHWIWLISEGAAQRLDIGGSLRDTSPIHKAHDAIGTSYARGTLWINDGGAVGIDATSGAIEVRIPVFTIKQRGGGGIAQLGNRVWLADPDSNRVFGLSLS